VVIFDGVRNKKLKEGYYGKTNDKKRNVELLFEQQQEPETYQESRAQSQAAGSAFCYIYIK